MRFASVYQGWETLEDFEAAISVLRVGHSDIDIDNDDADDNEIGNASASGSEESDLKSSQDSNN